jgi:hypothetical protein
MLNWKQIVDKAGKSLVLISLKGVLYAARIMKIAAQYKLVMLKEEI